MSLAAGSVPLAEVVRNGFVESVHHGCVALVGADGDIIGSAGQPQTVIFPRSALKPLQLAAMLDAGLQECEWTATELAVMASSHSGESMHTSLVRSILHRFDLDDSVLANTPGWPMDQVSRESLIRKGAAAPASIYADCSGKHAAMIITCAINDWPLVGYTSAQHPLQQRIAATVEAFTGDHIEHQGVDGCGAALFSCTVAGLARAYARVMTAPAGSSIGQVRDAMRQHPELVAGTTRDVTALMNELPGLLVKDGAEGVMAAGLPDGRAIALKIADGAARPRANVLTAALRALDVDISDVNSRWIRADVQGGGGIVGYLQETLNIHWEA